MDNNSGEFDHTNINKLDAAFFAEKIKLLWEKGRHLTQDVTNPIWEYSEAGSIWYVQIQENGIDTHIIANLPSPEYGGPTEDDVREALGQSPSINPIYFTDDYGIYRQEFLRNFAPTVYMELEKVLGKQLPKTDEIELDKNWSNFLPRSQYASRLAHSLQTEHPENSIEHLFSKILNGIADIEKLSTDNTSTMRDYLITTLIRKTNEVGKLLELARHKPREKAFVSGWKHSDAGNKSRVENAALNSERNNRICRKMFEYINKGQSKNRAAELTKKNLRLDIGIRQIKRIIQKNSS